MSTSRKLRVDITTELTGCQDKLFHAAKIDTKKYLYSFYNLFVIFFVLHYRASLSRVVRKVMVCTFFARIKLFSFLFY